MTHAPEEQAHFYKLTHKFLMMLFLVTIERRLFSEVFPLEDIQLFIINFILRFPKPVDRLGAGPNRSLPSLIVDYDVPETIL